MGLFSSKKTIPATGFYTLPADYQNLYTGLLSQAKNILLPGGQVNTEMFTPLAQTADEQKAAQMIRQGLAPTPESLQSDISMLMNPYDSYVIDEMNRQSQGQNSVLNQALNRTGQMGSNRSILGASDIETQRLGQIGQFRQNQYNNAVNTSLGALSSLRQQDIGNLMNVGGFERGLDTATKQAPLSALTAGQQALGGFKTEFGNFGSPEQTVKTGTGMGATLGALAGFAVGGPVGAGIGGAIGGGLEGNSVNGDWAGGALSGGIGGYTGYAGGGAGGGLGGLLSSSGLTGGSGSFFI